MIAEPTAAEPAYARNPERFARFYALQGSLAGRLALHPAIVRAWLEALPARGGGEAESAKSARAARPRRSVRLGVARRRELGALLSRAESGPEAAGELGRWLLGAVPVCTYLEIVGFARPSLREVDPEADEYHRELLHLRTALFLANYGLAKEAARQRPWADFSEQLSAASSGLLDAIDRYVPDDRAARFGYFAGYWIRYHLGRNAQKSRSTVRLPVNQHRLSRRIQRYCARRQTEGRPEPSAAEICAALGIGRETLRWQQLRPTMISLHGAAADDEEAGAALEHCLSDPAAAPADALEEAEAAAQLRRLFKARTEPATRVMLAYLRCIGGLADAAEDYLAALERSVLERLR